MTPDECCMLCKNPYGICLTRHTCTHHRLAQAQDDLDHETRKTYANPTQDRAIARAMRSKRKARQWDT